MDEDRLRLENDHVQTAATKSQHQMKRALLLDVVVSQGSSVFQLLASKDETLLIGWNSFLILDLLLHLIYGVPRFNFKRNCLASQGLHEDLHASSQSQHKMQGAFLLYVVVRQRAAIFKLLASKYQTLLIRWNSFLVLDLLLHLIDRVPRFYLQSDRLSRQCFNENLHSLRDVILLLVEADFFNVPKLKPAAPCHQ